MDAKSSERNQIMTDEMQEAVSKLSPGAQVYFESLVAEAANPFTAVKRISADLEAGTVEPEYRPAAALAKTRILRMINGEPDVPLTGDAALEDMRERIEAARLSGDEASYNALQGGLERFKTKKAETAERAAKQVEALNEQTAKFEEQQKARYESVLAETKAIQMQRIRGMSLDLAMHPDKAEAYYEKHHAAAVARSVQQATGYTPPKSPIDQ
jgi:hypothetical protein